MEARHFFPKPEYVPVIYYRESYKKLDRSHFRSYLPISFSENQKFDVETNFLLQFVKSGF